MARVAARRLGEEQAPMEIVVVETQSLGDRSYLIVDGASAAAVDPQRDIDRFLSVIDERRLRLTHVFETHIHNDYVTGGLELARRTGAAYVLPADEEVAYERTGARDGDEFPVGDLVVRAVHTPGHTPTHLSYVVAEGGTDVAAFTGGSLLYGTVGRTDLIGAGATEWLTRAQFRSVRRLAALLPAAAELHPTHGFGSFCSSASAGGSGPSTVGQERASNIALVDDDEDAFVEQLLGGLTAYPRYYRHMAPLNRSGPAPVDLSPPPPVEPEELRRRIAAGEWVVDLRSRRAFAGGHLAGTVNVEAGDSFATYLGWTMPWGTPATLVGDTRDQVAEAQRDMARIGIDRPAGAVTGGPRAWAGGGELRSYRVVSFADLADASTAGDVTVLDVRRVDEWDEGHVEGAVNVPLHDLEERVDEIPGGEVWVHCHSGYRAAIAASLLDRGGRTVVLVDDEWAAVSEHDALRLAGAA